MERAALDEPQGKPRGGDHDHAHRRPQQDGFDQVAADATTCSMHGPRYTSLTKLLAAKRVADLFT